MGTQELVWYCIITHWTHMEDMEWFSSIIFCDMPANGISFTLEIGGAMVKWPKYFYPLILMKIGGWIEYDSIKMGRKILDEKNDRKVPFWWENDPKKSFYQWNAIKPMVYMHYGGCYDQKFHRNCCMYSSDGVPKVLLKKIVPACFTSSQKHLR